MYPPVKEGKNAEAQIVEYWCFDHTWRGDAQLRLLLPGGTGRGFFSTSSIFFSQLIKLHEEGVSLE